ncbi:MAG: shikimate dehydrogenase [Acidobacteria bacterium]|nr:MAG: shikimate dehydrogenase [Acidobacteriota bacterium]
MNHGKICVSVCARTIGELLDRAGAAPDFGLIELRFDCLEKSELAAEDVEKLRNNLARIFGQVDPERCITTFRPKKHGGHRELSQLERSNFWNMGFETELADLEEDVVDVSWSWLWGGRICSFHDFLGVPDDLNSVFHKLVHLETGLIKIAVAVEDATDAIAVWNLFHLAEKENIRLIPIAMGEAGKWTRILGLAHGAPLTYASLDEDGKTAPGQISSSDLRSVFRVKELDKDTTVFGLIAGDSSYSLSPFMHNRAFKTAGLNSVFVPLQTKDLDSFMRRMVIAKTREVELNFGGFSVTNPHKQSIMRYLDEIDETASKIGAVNTVKIENGKLFGYNTDAPGFIRPLKSMYGGDLKGATAIVVGAGGGARACIYALKNEGVDVTVMARDKSKAESLANEFEISAAALNTDHRPLTADILVNATPLGTRGEREDDSIATAEELGSVKIVYDLVYNPSETRLISEAKKAGVKTLGGIEMLIAQGAKQFEIWTGGEAPVEEMKSAIEERLK